MNDINTDQTYECIDCKETYCLEDGGKWSTVKEEWVCEGCHESDLQHCSTVYIVEDGIASKFYVGDLFVMTEHGDDTEIAFHRSYHTTSGWRGYYETTVAGFSPIVDGWTTGGWGDAVGARKATFNDWAQEIIEGDVTLPFPVVLVFDPTSNVFSTAVTVLIRPEDETKAKEWLNGTLDDLHDSLS